MAINDRITYDSAELIQMLEGELDKLGTFRFNDRYKTLLGSRFIEKLSNWDQNIRKQKDSPLTLVICGEFKRGKSSLINALLGEDVVTTNVTTETITTNKISYGQHENMIVLSGGKRVRLSDEELTHDKLRDILADLPEKGAKLEIKRPIELLKEITIIDTPGLGDSMEDFADDVAQALQQADAVVYVYSVSFPLSVQEQYFIKTAIKPQKYTELFLVGNFADIIETPEDYENVKRVSMERIKDILPGESPILLSALDERCRELDKKRPNDKLSEYFEKSFDEFRSRLSNLLKCKRDCVLPDRIERLIRGMIADLRDNLDSLANGLDMNVGDAQKRIDELNGEKDNIIKEHEEAYRRIDNISEELRGEAIGWLDDIINKMEKDITSINTVPVEDVKKYYAMYCADILQEAIEKCNDYFLMSLYDELDDVAKGISKKLSFQSSSAMPTFRISLQNKTWTKGDNVAMVTSMMYIPVISLAANYVAGAMREKKIKNSAPDILSEVKAQYPKLRTSAITSLSQAYADLSEKAKKQVSEYFKERTSEIEAQAEQSLAVARQDEESKQEIKTAISEINGVLDSISGKFIINTVDN